MKYLILPIIAIGAMVTLSAPSQAADRYSRYGYYSGHQRYHDRLEHRDFHRYQYHREAHRYPQTWRGHERLHDQLRHDRYHDRLNHRELHRGYVPYQRQGFGITGPGFYFRYRR